MLCKQGSRYSSSHGGYNNINEKIKVKIVRAQIYCYLVSV